MVCLQSIRGHQEPWRECMRVARCAAEGGHAGDDLQGLHRPCMERDSPASCPHMQRAQQPGEVWVAVEGWQHAHHRKRRQHSSSVGYGNRECCDCVGAQRHRYLRGGYREQTARADMHKLRRCMALERRRWGMHSCAAGVLSYDLLSRCQLWPVYAQHLFPPCSCIHKC